MGTKKSKSLTLVLLLIASLLAPLGVWPQEAHADPATVLFQDDFETGALASSWVPEIGTDLKKWTIGTDGGSKVLSNTETGEILITNGSTSWTDYSYEARVKAINGSYPGLIGRVQDKTNFYMLRLTKPGGEKNVEFSKRVNGTDTILATYPLDPTVNKWYTLKMEFIGNTIRGYLDGVKIIEYTDLANAYTSGKIGFRNKWAAFMADDIKVTTLPAKRTAYMDDFESGAIDSSWVSQASGSWTVVDNVYSGSPTKAIQLSNPSREGLLSGGVKALFDDSISASYIPHDANASAGVVGRLKDVNSYYLLRAAKPANQLELVKKMAGSTTVLQSVYYNFELDQPYTLSLGMLDDKLMGSVNGQELLRTADSSLTNGQAGVWAAGGISFIDNVVSAPLSKPGQDSISVSLNDSKMGRVYEGIGYVSSSGSSKLLMDYPPEQQKDIIDFLFKPNFGASLNHLKLEIGSDANSSSGTEPSHMRSETDFDITRGSGLWLAQKAKAVNPNLTLDALRWGTPKWITNNDQKYLFYKNYLQGAQDTYGLNFDYLGVDQNEGAFDRDYVVNKLRPSLNADGFDKVKLVARDAVNDPWGIATTMTSDTALRNTIDVIGGHYTFSSPAAAQALNKPLWHSEARPPYRTQDFRGSQGPLQDVVKGIMTSYVNGKMTKFEMQPFIEAWYDNVPYNTKGALVADKPWSGHYVLDRGVWLTAHFTQFANPGWFYVDSSSAVGDTFNYVTYKKPDSSDYSVVVVNTTEKPQKYMFTVSGGLSKGTVHPWKTTETEDFVQLPAIEPVDGSYSITLEPYSVYSITTTTGQQKGQAKYVNPVEENLKLPYTDNFDSYQLGKQPLYAEDQGGAFEIADLTAQGRSGKGVKQQITADIKPGDWRGTPDPYTLLGDLEWANYSVSTDVYLDGNTAGYVYVAGRVVDSPYSSAPAVGYNLKLAGNGDWQLRLGGSVLQSGSLPSFDAAQWHNLKLTFLNNQLTAYVDDASVTNDTIPLGGLSSGQIAIGSGYHYAYFDNLKVEQADPTVPVFVNRLDNADKSIQYTSAGNGKWDQVWQDYSQWKRTLSKASAGNVIAVNDRTLGTDYNQFNYTGTWSSNTTETAANNGDNSWTSVLNNGYSVKFNGTQAKIYAPVAPAHGIFAVSIDGGTEAMVDLYAPTRADQTLVYTSPELPAGDHTLRVRVTNTKNALSTGTTIVADRVDITTTQVNIAYLETSFTGTGFNLIGIVNPGNLKADVYVDGQLKDTVDTAITATGYKRALYRMAGLENKAHTLKVAFQSNVTLDALEIVGAPAGQGPTDPTDPDPVDKSSLTAAVSAAQSVYDMAVEGIYMGQYPVGLKAVLLTAIQAAHVVALDTAANQAQVDQAVTTLNAALESFKSGVITKNPETPVVVDKSGLTAAISTAQSVYDGAVEGIFAGQYPAGTKAALLTAIQTANGVAQDAAADQAKVDQAVTTLNAALETFKSGVVTFYHRRDHSSSSSSGTTSPSDPIQTGTNDPVTNGSAPGSDGSGNGHSGGSNPDQLNDLQFSDIPANYWAADVIHQLAGKHIIEGTDQGTFEPNREVTRAEFAAFIVRALQLKASGSVQFTDIHEGAWYATAVAAAVEAGIVQGRSETTFDPNTSITREEMVSMLMRAYEILKGASEKDSGITFHDEAQVSAWAADYVKKAAALGMIQGREDQQFVPKGLTTRAEAAQVIFNLLTKE